MANYKFIFFISIIYYLMVVEAAYIIDNDVDLAKKSEIWNVTVDNGNYVLCLRDKASYAYVYSDAFTVSQAKAYYDNDQTAQTEAYILPPLCVILVFANKDEGKFTKIFHTVMSLIGTIAYIPGVIHALYWVFVKIEDS
ncbi:hypothetical protein C2G38_2142639 [Gigaspora rosea]|uniref:Uncharacterized protein n=1 Tax=Gigaspora rosea TaxID=44941 RepID=A0A397V486_9GLOM|nr:hypothetical protein C2G38_2142639 [Gigaspora rosea]